MKESVPEARSAESGQDTAIETVPLERPTDDEAVLGVRSARIEALKEELNTLAPKANAEENALASVRERLGLAKEEASGKGSAIETRRHQLEAELVRTESNYPGDWTLALVERLRHSSTQEKMRILHEKYEGTFKQGVPGMLDKDNEFETYQRRHSDEFAERIERHAVVTETGPASSFGKTPNNVGSVAREGQDYDSRFARPGAVFSDASIDGKPLTIRQKNIIEAHEKGHAVREFSGPIGAEVREALDLHVLNEQAKKPHYSANPDEIIERMAQLKNYFGFTKDEVFTKEHLAYAKEHYLADTGLDNSMTEFFAAITPEREGKFLNVMNRYPI